MTVNRWPFKATSRPTTSPAPPKRFLHIRWLMTATGCALGVLSSSGEITRPSGARAERREVIAGDEYAVYEIGRFRLFIAVQTDGDAAIGRQPAEDFVPVSVINIVRIRDCPPWTVARAVKDEHQLARLRHWQLP